MILIQDGSQNTNVDKPLRIIGDPYKVQVSAQTAWSLEGSTVRPALGSCLAASSSILSLALQLLHWGEQLSKGCGEPLQVPRGWMLGQYTCLCPLSSVVCPQQACEMVMDILRERDQGGFGDRNEYGSRVGGGIDVSASTPERWAAGAGQS